MKDFAAFEAKYERTPVRLIDYQPASGVLYLQREDTLLHATSPAGFRPKPVDENGWFSLRIEAPQGNVILLHHALTLGETNHRWGGERTDTFSTEIFPNLVVEDIRGLTEDRLLSRIMFRVRGLKYFFYYRHAETLLNFKGTDEQIAALRDMRYDPACDEDLFAPRHVYVMHEYPSFLSFKVENRTYEVWAGGTEKFGNLHKLEVEAYPIASIAFDEPVDLDTALDRMWEWRAFFSQIAMLPLQVESAAVQPSMDLSSPMADLYMTGASHYPDFSNHYYKLSPAYVPLNNWDDRHVLSAAMQRWLEKEKDRGKFRRRLYRVIESMNLRTDARDLIELASAVESLDELSGGELMAPELLESMVSAAHQASVAAETEIDEGRIRGVLGNLQRPSLALRYARMGELVTPPVKPADAELLSRSATSIRNASAHGGTLDQQVQPRISPTLQALSALCARFDLETCGFPPRSGSDSRAMTKIRFDNGIDMLRQIEAEAASGATGKPRRRRSSAPTPEA